MVPSCSSIQGHNTQAQAVVQSQGLSQRVFQGASCEALGELAGMPDPLERVTAALDKTWKTLCDISSALHKTYEWDVGNLDAMSEDLEIEVRDLEALFEDSEVLSETRKFLTDALKVLKKSQESLRGVPSILNAASRAIERAFPDDAFRIAWAKDETLKAESAIMVSYAKCQSRLFKAQQARNQARDKAKKAEPGSVQPLVKSLQRLVEALLAHAEFRNAYVKSVEALGELIGLLDPLKKATPTLDKIRETLSGISSNLDKTYEWIVGSLDAMSEDLEVEVGKLEALPKDFLILSKAREFFVDAVKVLQLSQESARWIPAILVEVPGAIEAASSDEALRITWFYQETLKVQSTVMVSHAKCRSCVLEVLQARDKAEQGTPESVEPLANSLRKLGEALLTHVKIRKAYVRSVENLSMELKGSPRGAISDSRQLGIGFIPEGVDFMPK